MIAALSRIHAAIVRRLPDAFRNEYADELRRTFDDRVAERARASRWRGTLEAALGCLDASAVLVRHRAPSLWPWRDWAGAPREAATSLARTPLWSLTVVAILGLGIAATTTVFSVVSTVVVRPLPYPDAADLVRIGSVRQGRPQLGSVSAPNFTDLRASTRAFDVVAASSPSSMAVSTGDGPAEMVRGGLVSGDFFRLLGVPARLGRTLDASDDRPDAAPVVVLGHRLWVERFGGGMRAVGEHVTIDGRAFEVAGVMGPDFQPPEGAHLGDTLLWVPLAYSPFPLAERTLAFLDVIGRRGASSSAEAGYAELDRIGRGLAATYALRPRAFETFQGAPLRDETIGEAGARLWLLMGSVALLLALTCANVAQLMLARTVARTRELAVRSAIGGGRARVRAYVASQAVLLAGAGGVVGLAAAHLGVGAVRRWAPVDLPRLAELRMDGTVLAFAVAIAAAAALIVGLGPARRATRGDEAAVLRAARGATAGRRGSRMRDGLVVVQTAIGLVLLAGAGLLGRSLLNLEQVDPGFSADGLLVATVRLADPVDATTDRPSPANYQDLLNHVSAVPGVRAVSLSSGAPFVGGGWTTYIEPVGQPLDDQEKAEMRVGLHQVSDGHLAGLGISPTAGRDILATDTSGTEPVAVISRSIADRFWPAGDALGRSLVVGGDGAFTPRRIVGIVDAPLYSSRRQRDGLHVYLPIGQFPPPEVDIMVRATPAPGVADGVRAAVFEAVPDAPIRRLVWMRDLLARELVEPRFITGLLGSMAVIAVVLTLVGIVSTLAYAVEQRRQEVGVRLALGARRGQVVRLVLGRAVWLVGLGLLAGLGLVSVAAPGLEAFVFGVTTTDAGTIAALTAGLAVAALAAAWWPARRAGRVDPVRALGAE